MKKHWQILAYDPDIAAALMQAEGLSPTIARIMAARGFNDQQAVKSFLSPALADMADPTIMADMQKATARLLQAVKNQEKVCVYGDYDVDGITATAMLVEAFTEMGIKTDYHIPNRLDDGYGLNVTALQQIMERGYKLIVSVDCGIASLQEAAFCTQHGVDLLITDHHLPQEELPAATAVINPLREDCPYPFKGLAGVGVAFNLLVALRKKLREHGLLANDQPDLRRYLDLVALGTIADMVPLTDQNRLLVTAGLQRMADDHCRTGIAALKKVAGISGAVSAGQVGFRLAPRLNAASRLESALPGLELLLAKDMEEALSLAQELDTVNSERQQVERRIFEEARSLFEISTRDKQPDGIVLASPFWHQGVVGIVASRMVELYHKPVILLAERDDGTLTGSGRSIPGFHLLDALHDCAEHLLRYGGHRAAAGLSLQKSELPAFTSAFEKAATAQFVENDFKPILKIDSEITVDELSIALVKELASLAPFGVGNPEPTLLIRNLQVLEATTVGDGHLKMRLQQNKTVYPAIGWRMAGAQIAKYVDIAAIPEINSWGGGERLQLRLKGIRESR